MSYRAVFLSDIHLGTRACKAELLERFLEQLSTEHLYLVGDIVDLARLRRRWYWPESHRRILARLIDLSRDSAEAVYLPGNHDEPIEAWEQFRFAGLRFEREHIHQLADGRRLLLTHGDVFDAVLHEERRWGAAGIVLYAILVAANRGVAAARRRLGMEYWSLADHVKRRVGKVQQAIGRFRASLCHLARKRGCDGVLAGHVHIAAIEDHGGVLYCNTGDWVDSCTCIVEEWSGELRVVDWVSWNRERRQEQEAPAYPNGSLAAAGAAYA